MNPSSGIGTGAPVKSAAESGAALVDGAVKEGGGEVSEVAAAGGAHGEKAAEAAGEANGSEAVRSVQRRASDGTASTDSQGRANVMVETEKGQKTPKLLPSILFAILGWVMAVGFLIGMIIEVTKDRTLFFDPPTQNASQWSYIGLTSPPEWGNLSTDYKTCGVGRLQSPININRGINSGWVNDPSDNNEVGMLGDVVTLPSGTVTVRSRIEDFAPVFYCQNVACMSVSIPGVGDFSSDRFLFRTPSEHVYDGLGSEVEIQFYATGQDNGSFNGTVVSVLYTLNAPETDVFNSSASQTVVLLIQSVGASGEAEVDLSTLLPSLQYGYYAYNGSLPYPPCSEGYRYMVMKAAVQIAPQLGELYSQYVDYPGNARSQQPDNGRAVYNYGRGTLPTPTPDAASRAVLEDDATREL